MHTIQDRAVRAVIAASTLLGGLSRRDDRGEGVISAAIVVLIMALIGAAMWVAFKAIFDDATQRATDEISRIGG